MLENLIKFLSENGVEIPENATVDQILEMLKSLLDADKPEDETQENKSDETTESKTPEPKMGVS